MGWPIPLPEPTGDNDVDEAAVLAWEEAMERLRHPGRFHPDGSRVLPYARREDCLQLVGGQPVTVRNVYTAPGRPFTYYLGVPEVVWAERTPVPVCLSAKPGGAAAYPLRRLVVLPAQR